jgi:pimeloyl-ACP methyl ester carboxylesterase
VEVEVEEISLCIQTQCDHGQRFSVILTVMYRSRAAAAAFGASTLVVVGSSSSVSSFSSSTAAVVPLASSINRRAKPTVVLIHGLDSAKDTWSSASAKLIAAGVPTLAIDLRGHGESPLGDVEDFSAEALAADVEASVRAHGLDSRPIILVGHSMGGRVVMRVAANYPDLLEDGGALVIEDMDIRVREDSHPNAAQAQRLNAFDRRFASFADLKNALQLFGYGAERISGWAQHGRVYPVASGSSWWSGINPMAQHLAIKHILATQDGRDAWRTSIANAAYPVHLQIAAQGSAARESGEGGVEEMVALVPRCEVRRFPESYHSIHNSARRGGDEWVEHILEIVDAAAAATGARSRL